VTSPLHQFSLLLLLFSTYPPLCSLVCRRGGGGARSTLTHIIRAHSFRDTNVVWLNLFHFIMANIP
jgi:hypothetical protein